MSIHCLVYMERQGLTIAQAARELGVSTRTIRRFIKSGKVSAELVPGPFGEEYRIQELPAVSHKPATLDSKSSQSTGQAAVQSSVQSVDIIRELHEKNLNLAAQLGAATERIRNLENQLRLLAAARQRPWWKRLFLGKHAGA
jgi:MerR family copper efflux transcriptional regulator